MEGPRAHISTISNNDAALRRAVRIVAMLNLAYFGVEFGVALAIGSVSLFADSIDFLEDVHWSVWRSRLFCSLRV